MPRPLWIVAVLVLALGAGWLLWNLPVPPPPAAEAAPGPGDAGEGPLGAALPARLAADVEHLALAIGERHTGRPAALAQSAAWLEGRLGEAGWVVEREGYQADGLTVHNLLVTRAGALAPDEIVVVGAHYDSVPGSPGANDNASGVATLLALARAFAPARTPAPDRTLRLAFFVNEEPPFFQTELMGSLVSARRGAARGEQVVAMIALDSLGYYSDEPDSQHLPGPVAWMAPDTGDFLGVVGNLDARALQQRVSAALERAGTLPVVGGCLPGDLPGVGWSDHWSFWQVGAPAVLLTDTALYRDPAYHRWNDAPQRLDHERLAAATRALAHALQELLRVEP